jgi:CRISPR/Cas system-associated exonuclease Cas4 (RecB family)
LTTFAPTAVRASEMARCPRMAALRGLGTEQQEYDEQTRRYFARGHLYTEYVVRQLRVKHGAENVEREVEIHWPLGVGHADAYVKPSKLLCEIKSTVTPTTSSPMFDMAVQQLRIYLRFHPEAERGALYLINPSDLRGEDVFEVKLTDEDVTAIDEAVLRVSEALSGGELPDRVCRKPGEGRAHLCPFIEPCFQGWEPPPANQVSDADAVDAASRRRLRGPPVFRSRRWLSSCVPVRCTKRSGLSLPARREASTTARTFRFEPARARSAVPRDVLGRCPGWSGCGACPVSVGGASPSWWVVDGCVGGGAGAGGGTEATK